MALDNFTGQNIKDTFQRVVQTDGVNFADGTGSIIPIALSTQISGAFYDTSASFSTRVTLTETSASSMVTDSGSFSARVTLTEATASTLTSASESFSTRVTSTEATASTLTSASESFSTRITLTEASASSMVTDSGSFSTRVTLTEATASTLTSASESFSTRVTLTEASASTLTSASESFSTRITLTEASASRTDVTFTNISSSRVTASQLLVTDDTRLDGSIAFNGVQIFEDQLVVRSGSTIFGSGSIPSDVTHQFTGSVFITGSNLTLADGIVTAPSFVGIFRGVISSSAQLSSDFMSGTAFTPAGISGSWQGQSFISASQVQENIGGGVISSSAQVKLNLPANTISSSAQIKLNLPANTISSSAQIKLNLPAGVISSSLQTLGDITSSGNISASGHLFISASTTASALNTLMYDTDTGQVYYTGSYGGGGGGGDFSAVGENIIPSADGSHNLGAFDKKWQAIFAIDTFFGGIHEINLETKGLDQLQPGTVLVSKAGQMVPCTAEADPLIMGIVSSGSNFPIILGAEPVLVNGPVYEGDYIITSNITGHGKAVNPSKIFELQLFGKIIAQSLETNIEGGIIRAMIRKM